MKRSIGVRWGKLKVGLLVMFAIATAMWASLTGGGTSIFESKGMFICYFKNVNGLVNGSPVWMSGVEVGNVRSVTFVNLDSLRQVKVTCRVKKSVWHMLTKDSEVALGTIGFLGDKYVEIFPGTKGLELVKENEVIATRDVGEAAAMFKAGETALNRAGSLAGNLDTLLGRMNRGEGTLGQLATDKVLYQQMTRLLSDLALLTRDLQKNQERLTSSIEKIGNFSERLTSQVTEGKGSVGKLMDDPALYDRLASTSARLDSITAKINSRAGNMGLLVNDTALYNEVTNLIVRINNLVTDIEKNPRKYFKFSVF
ncbi:MAG: MlaD family protein [Candidatus Zixiibacteriota bacterium]